MRSRINPSTVTTIIGAGVLGIGVLVGCPNASAAFGQATPASPNSPATQPVTQGESAALTVRMLVSRAGAPDVAGVADHLLTIGEPNDAPQIARDAAAWIKANRDAVVGVRKGVLPASPWGLVTHRPAAGDQPEKLYLHVFEWHASGKVIAYGLPSSQIKRAYLHRDPSTALKVEGTDRDAHVVVAAKNAKAPDPIATVVVLELAGPLSLAKLEQPQSADGTITLHSKDSVVVGKNLRYEPEPNKITVGYWTNPADWVYWEVKVEKPGEYDVELLQGCGKGSGGSEVEVTIEKQSLPMVVQDTGHFQNFVPRRIGRVTLSAGTHRFEVKVKQKKGVAVMDLRQVTLTPAK